MKTKSTISAHWAKTRFGSISSIEDDSNDSNGSDSALTVDDLDIPTEEPSFTPRVGRLKDLMEMIAVEEFQKSHPYQVIGPDGKTEAWVSNYKLALDIASDVSRARFKGRHKEAKIFCDGRDVTDANMLLAGVLKKAQ